MIDWEHNAGALGTFRESASVYLFLGLTRDHITNTCIGFFCRWRCRLYSKGNQVFGCISEQMIPINPSKLSEESIESFIGLTFEAFQEEIGNRLNGINLHFVMKFELDSKQVPEFLESAKEFGH